MQTTKTNIHDIEKQIEHLNEQIDSYEEVVQRLKDKRDVLIIKSDRLFEKEQKEMWCK